MAVAYSADSSSMRNQGLSSLFDESMIILPRKDGHLG